MHVSTSVCACVCPLGFQVVGGEKSGHTDHGTIISSITPGGPADLNGCLNPGRPHSPRSLYFCEGGLCFYDSPLTIARTGANIFLSPPSVPALFLNIISP